MAMVMATALVAAVMAARSTGRRRKVADATATVRCSECGETFLIEGRH